MKRKHEEVLADMRTALSLQDDHKSDIIFFKTYTQKLKQRILDLESSLMRQYAPQKEINKTLDLLV